MAPKNPPRRARRPGEAAVKSQRRIAEALRWQVDDLLVDAGTRRVHRGDTDLSITEIAFQTGWSSLGTFGRTFRDVTGESPGALRAREQAVSHHLDRAPHCFVSAAHRPTLNIAVSEKRRRETGARTDGSQEKEVP